MVRKQEADARRLVLISAHEQLFTHFSSDSAYTTPLSPKRLIIINAESTNSFYGMLPHGPQSYFI